MIIKSLWMFLVLNAALVSNGCALLGTESDTTPNTPSPSPSVGSEVRGMVRSVNVGAHTVTLDAANTSQSNLRNSNGTVITYDRSTVLEYQGRKSNNPEDLEIGDQIEAQVERSGSILMARNIRVITSVSDNPGSNNAVGAAWNATVRSVNFGDRSIELVQSGRDQFPIRVRFDANTRVEFQGRTYRPEDLQRDDEVQVRTHNSGSQVIVDQIVVTRNVNDSVGAAGQRLLSGTVRNVNASARSIELDSVNVEHIQGFDVNRNGNTVTVSYDTNTIVEYQGQRYGVVNLERGDVVNVDVSRIGNGYLAKRIIVAQSR